MCKQCSKAVDWKLAGELYPIALSLCLDDCERGKVSMMFDRPDLLQGFINSHNDTSIPLTAGSLDEL